ncbi:MAG: hypothetical protein AAF648_04915 [Pseudomonadota bacterium]
MIFRRVEWGALFAIPAALCIIAGNIEAAAMVIVVGSAFGLGFWMGLDDAETTAKS